MSYIGHNIRVIYPCSPFLDLSRYPRFPRVQFDGSQNRVNGYTNRIIRASIKHRTYGLHYRTYFQVSSHRHQRGLYLGGRILFRLSQLIMNKNEKIRNLRAWIFQCEV